MLPANLQQRAATASVLAAIVTLILFLASMLCVGRWLAVIIALAVVVACAIEFSTFSTQASLNFRRRIIYLLILLTPSLFTVRELLEMGICGDALHFQLHFTLSGFALPCKTYVVSLVIATLYMVCIGRETLEQANEVAREIYLGLFLVGFCGAMLITLVALPYSGWAVGWLLLTVCGNDIAAYLIGSKLAGPKLAPVISPGKTISGSCGGLIIGTLIGLSFSWMLSMEYSMAYILFMSAMVVLASQVGDLAKSYLKRLHAVKDSGNILPGHGGVLDRVDSILFAAPVFAMFL